MELTKNILYPGCVVQFRQEPHFVYKTNDKSLYIGKLPFNHFEIQFAEKTSETTPTEFFNKIKAIKVNYTDILVSKEDFEKYKQTKELSVFAAKKSPVSKSEEIIIQKLFNKVMDNKPYRYPILEGSHFMVAIAASKENKMMLLHIEEEYWIYNIENRLFFPFVKDKHYKKPEILWDKVVSIKG